MNLTLSLRLSVGLLAFVIMACEGDGTQPVEELPVLSGTWTSFNADSNDFFVSVTFTHPVSDTIPPDSIWTTLFVLPSEDDTSGGFGVSAPIVRHNLMDDGTSGDILPEDDVYSRKFASPLPDDEDGPVRFVIGARAAGAVYAAYDTLYLGNIRPTIAALFAPDTLVKPPVGSAANIHLLRALVIDANGREDIKRVGFYSRKPDSTLANSGNLIPLLDNGDSLAYGDTVAADGIYSVLIQLSSTNDEGTYHFLFTAEDFSGAVSDTVDHPVEVVAP